MDSIARIIASEKDRLDTIGRQLHNKSFFTRLCYRLQGINTSPGWSAISPTTYIRNALPFSNPQSDRSRCIITCVDSAQIISGTYKNYSPSPYFQPCHPDKVMELSDSAAVFDRSMYLYTPTNCKIGDFPLYVALEGKNRVELFKNANRHMKALTTNTFYPKASQLEIHLSWPFKVYSLSYKGQRRVLPFAKEFLPLLRAYGVKDSKKRTFSIYDYCRWRNARIAITKDQMR